MGDIRLIASDLDGTLLDGVSSDISEDMFKCIDKMAELGIRFAVATGRQYYNVKRLFSPVKDEILYLCENGGLLADGEKVIKTHVWDEKYIKPLVQAIDEHPEMQLLYSGDKHCFIYGDDEAYVHRICDVLKNDCIIIHDTSEIDEPCIKLAAYRADDINPVVKYYEDLVKDMPGIKAAKSGSCWIDFIADDINKGSGLKELGEYLHVETSQIACFGDNFNDVDMFKAAGVSYAMKAADKAVQAYATHITDNVVDSIYKDIINS